MSRRRLVFMIAAGLLSLMGCSKVPEESTAMKSVAEEGIQTGSVPKGCDIITEEDKFTRVTKNQEYQEDTDFNMQMAMLYGVADAGDVLYANFSQNYLFYFNKKLNNGGLLCGKSDCPHNSQTCNAVLWDMQGLAVYQGELYTVCRESLSFIKVSSDGAERREICNLFWGGEQKKNTNGCMVNWILHRGYIYYFYQNHSGMTEDTYYLNNSNCLYRRKLDGTGEPECILVFECASDSIVCKLKGAGSYVYMNVPEKGGFGGSLCRYNTESGQVEKLTALGNDVCAYTICKGGICYADAEGTSDIYFYNSETGEKRIFATEPNTVLLLYSDADYLYAGYEDKSREDCRQVIGVWDWNGNQVAQIPMRDISEDNKSILEDFCGSDEDRIYLRQHVITESEEDNIWGLKGNGYTALCYIEKSDISDGEYELRELK